MVLARNRWFVFILMGVVVCGVIWVVGAAWLMQRSAEGRLYSDVTSIPQRHAGLVLGCSRLLGDGRRNAFFDNRIEAAAALFHAKKVEFLIVSGDNHVAGYDEPADMKATLVERGVPADRVYCDYAGFRTLDSIVRAREIFDQTTITVVSQRFHNQRAIFIASHRNIDAIGFNAPEVEAYNGFKTKVRELGARANTLLDEFVWRRGPRFLGPKVVLVAARPE